MVCPPRNAPRTWLSSAAAFQATLIPSSVRVADSFAASPQASLSDGVPGLRPCVGRPLHRRALLDRPFRASSLHSIRKRRLVSCPRTRISMAIPAALSSMIFIAANQALIQTFRKFSISFPPPLFGMLLLFISLSLSRYFFPRRSAAISAWTENLLAPGAEQLSRWLAVFFAPNLIMLPLAPTLASSDATKVAILTTCGFLVSLISTALLVIVLRRGNWSGEKVVEENPTKAGVVTWPNDRVVVALVVGAIGLLVGGVMWSEVRWIGVARGVVTTLACFAIGMRMPSQAKKFVHPLVFCTAGTIAGVWAFGTLSGVGLQAALGSYMTRGPFQSWGGGDILAYMTGPAVITFGCQMDRRRKLMRERGLEVVGATAAASFLGLFGTAAVVRWMGLGQRARLLMLPRMITAPLAVPIAEMIGAHVGLASTVVAVTGLLGANFGPQVLSLCGVKDPVVRGLAVGSASHGLGTAAMSGEKNAFPFAAIAMATVGVISTVLVAIPRIRAALITLALGQLARVASLRLFLH